MLIREPGGGGGGGWLIGVIKMTIVPASCIKLKSRRTIFVVYPGFILNIALLFCIQSTSAVFAPSVIRPIIDKVTLQTKLTRRE